MTGDIRILILAAGASSRMRGRDKLAEPVDGVPLLARQVGTALATECPVVVALPPRPHPRYEMIGPAAPLEVPSAADGMGVTLAAGVAHLADADAILVLLADLPEITADDLMAVLNAEHGLGEIVRGSSEDGRPGHPLLIPSAAFNAFMDLKGDDGGREVVGRFPTRVVPLPGRRAVLDLDTPEEWDAWRASRG